MKTKLFFPCAVFTTLIICTFTAAADSPSAPRLPEKNLPGPVGTNAAEAVVQSPANRLYYEANQSMIVSNWTDAIPKLKKAVQLDPTLFPAWEQLGWCYWKNGQRDETFRLWETLRRLNPDLPAAYNLLGRAYTADGQEAKAVEAFRISLQLDPDQDATQFSMARLDRWKGRYDDSISILQDQLDREPGRADVRLELARAYLNNWQFDEALPLWEQLAVERGDAESQIALAECRLKTGDPESAREMAEQLLSDDPDHPAALLLMADLSEYSDRPADARPYLRRLIATTDSLPARQKLRMRLILLIVRLNNEWPLDYTLNEAINQAKEFLKDDPKNVDAILLLGELLMMDHKFTAAEDKFQIVLRDFNPANQRAHRGLFETYTADRKFNKAEKELRAIESFNPRDPYLHYLRAKYEASRGHFSRAYRALDQLEAAGQNGAVLVLLYHGLSNSEWTEVPSVRLFRSQLLALQEAGFRFIAPDDLPDYFASLESTPQDTPTNETPDRVAIVTFDDARLDSFRLATPVMQELGIPMAMHVPIGNIVRSDPFLASWKQLADYRDQGWILGSHLYEASTPVAGDADGTPIRPLASRIWLPDENRMETSDEFRQRIQQEYTLSRDLMQAHLEVTPDFLAYPMGDIGQETWGNEPDAMWINLQAAATNYQIGFLQSSFGYTIASDNPLLYQRRELGRYLAASNTADSVLKTHPVFLARVSRAQLATLEGKHYMATRIVDQLDQDQYPKTSLSEIAHYSRSKLSRKFAAPPIVENVRKGPLNLNISEPYVGVRGDYFSDSLERSSYHVFGFGGLNLTPNIVIEGFAGYGQIKQGRDDLGGTNILQEVSVDETDVGVKGSFTFPGGNMIAADYMLRRFDAPVDEDVSTYGVEGQLKPFLPLDLAARYEHNVEPSARTLLRDIVTYDLWMANGVFSLRDWWDLWGSGQYYTFSDNNNRVHGSVASQWLLWEPIGLHFGLRYAYASSDEEREDYWTPYELHRFYLELALRRTYLRTYYSLKGRAGIGKQAVRPEAEERHQAQLADANEQVARATREHWPKADYNAAVAYRNELLADPPEEEWKPVYGVSASIRSKLGKHWELHGEASFNKVTDYDELNLFGDITFRF